MIWFVFWLLTVELIGLGALPLAARLFRFLPDRGLVLAKPLGMLLVGYAAWVLTLFGVLRFERAPLLVLALALAAAAWLAWGRSTLKELRTAGGGVLVAEGLFLLAFAAASLFRAFNPEIAGTEKPMDMAFLNTLQRTQVLPPEDPWMSGHGISYYYFGYLLLAMVGKMSGVPASVGYNLAVALVFSLLLAGSYSVVFNLLTAVVPAWGATRRAIGAVVGPLVVGIMGNLEIGLEVLAVRGFGDESFWQTAGIEGLRASAEPTGWFPDSHWWWWRASRVIPTIEPDGINEFPFFSFLLGDLHPHFTALPWALLAVSLSLAAILKRDAPSSSADRWIWTLAPALALGFLLVGNSWDFPTYAGLFWLASCGGALLAAGGKRAGASPVIRCLPGLLAVSACSILMYLPFMVGFGSQVKGIGMSADRTPLVSMLIIFGPFLFLLAAFLLWRGWVNRASLGPAGAVVMGAGALMVAASWWLGAVALLAGLLLMGGCALTAAFSGGDDGVAPGANDGSAASGPADARWESREIRELGQGAAGFLSILITAGLLLILVPEFVFLSDNFGTRMNTVFKFHYQAWVLLGLATSVALVWMLGTPRAAGARALLATGATLLIAVGLLYPVASVPARAQGFERAPTLDGAAYYASAYPDEYAAIRWLADHASPGSVVLEASGGQYSAYARVSTFSGVPTVLGWAGHEVQWRGSGTEIQRRLRDIDGMYRSADAAELASLLGRYRVQYIFVGRLEREKYGPEVVSTFDRFPDLLRPVFSQGAVTVYQVESHQASSVGAGS